MFIADSSSLDLPEHCFSANRLHSCGRISRHCAKGTLCQGVPMQSCLKLFCDDCHEETSFQNFSVLKYVTAKLPGLDSGRWNQHQLSRDEPDFLLASRGSSSCNCGVWRKSHNWDLSQVPQKPAYTQSKLPPQTLAIELHPRVTFWCCWFDRSLPYTFDPTTQPPLRAILQETDPWVLRAAYCCHVFYDIIFK